MSIEFMNCIINDEYSGDQSGCAIQQRYSVSLMDRLHNVNASQPQHRAVQCMIVDIFAIYGYTCVDKSPCCTFFLPCMRKHRLISVYGLPSLQVSQFSTKDVRYFTGYVCATELAAGDVAVLAILVLSWATRLDRITRYRQHTVWCRKQAFLQ